MSVSRASGAPSGSIFKCFVMCVSLIESAKLNLSVSRASGSPRDSVFGRLCVLCYSIESMFDTGGPLVQWCDRSSVCVSPIEAAKLNLSDSRASGSPRDSVSGSFCDLC